MDWVKEELSTLSLGDKRLKKRAQKVLAHLNRNPTDSIPSACSGAGETKAAYRFFDNDRVTPEKLYKTHFRGNVSANAGTSGHINSSGYHRT